MTRVLCTGVLSFLSCMPFAGADEKDELRAAILVRCLYQVGEFGNDMVQKCVEQDMAAERALAEYPADAQAVVATCRERFNQNNADMVKLCVERDMAANAAIAQHEKKHPDLVRTCKAQTRNAWPADVQACIDSRLGAAENQ